VYNELYNTLPCLIHEIGCIDLCSFRGTYKFKRLNPVRENYYTILCLKFAMYISCDDEDDLLFEWLDKDRENWNVLFRICSQFRSARKLMLQRGLKINAITLALLAIGKKF
jgi:hypothetical protein